MIIWSILLFLLGLFLAGLGVYGFFACISDGEGGYTLLSLLLAVLGIAMIIGAFGGFSSYSPSEEDIAQAQANYIEAYESTVALENYTVGSEISFEKNGLFGGGISISGDISKNNGIYSGDVVMEMPGNTYNYTYASPYGEIDTWASMNKGEKSIFLPFNVANLGAGIIQPLSDEIISTGVPTSENLQTIKFSVTNEQAYELYGSIIDYFKKAAEKSIDISDLKFSSGTITVTIQNGMIKDYKVVLDGNASAGSITCKFSCTVK